MYLKSLKCSGQHSITDWFGRIKHWKHRKTLVNFLEFSGLYSLQKRKDWFQLELILFYCLYCWLWASIVYQSIVYFFCCFFSVEVDLFKIPAQIQYVCLLIKPIFEPRILSSKFSEKQCSGKVSNRQARK